LFFLHFLHDSTMGDQPTEEDCDCRVTEDDEIEGAGKTANPSAPTSSSCPSSSAGVQQAMPKKQTVFEKICHSHSSHSQEQPS